eukprot:gene3207-3418_t
MAQQLAEEVRTATPLLETTEILYEDNTNKIYYKKRLVRLQITTQDILIYLKDSSGVVNTPIAVFSHKDLLGSHWKLLQKKQANQSTVHQYNLHYYFVKKSWFGCGEAEEKQRSHKEVHLYVYNCDEAVLDNWNTLLYRIIHHEFPQAISPSSPSSSSSPNSVGLLNHPQLFSAIPQRCFLVFVNPVSGKRKAFKVWKKTVEPMLKQANIKVEVIVTEFGFHAKEYIANPDNSLSQYHCILTVGGDGILYEVINGAMLRPDAETIMQQVPIVPIPGGTGNGLSRSILYTIKEDPSPVNAVFNVVKGKSFPFDLSRIETVKDGKTHYAFLMLSWGLISDIDIHSETLRFLGEMRLYVYAVYFILQRRIYRGKLRMKLLPETTITDTDITSKVSINKLIPSDIVQEDNWVLLDGEFVLCCILQASHLTKSMHFGPGIRLNDGAFTVYVAQAVSRLQMINILLSGDSGGHIYSRSIRVFQCSEYELEPLTANGVYSLDGEVVEYGPVRGRVLPSAARVRLMDA